MNDKIFPTIRFNNWNLIIYQVWNNIGNSISNFRLLFQFIFYITCIYHIIIVINDMYCISNNIPTCILLY